MDCYVKAIIGDGNDAGGNTGGIVGRVKNESSVYYTHIERCYYEGTIIAKETIMQVSLVILIMVKDM